jgi:hypothetical protein
MRICLYEGTPLLINANYHIRCLCWYAGGFQEKVRFKVFIILNPDWQINTGKNNKIWDNLNPYDNPEVIACDAQGLTPFAPFTTPTWRSYLLCPCLAKYDKRLNSFYIFLQFRVFTQTHSYLIIMSAIRWDFGRTRSAQVRQDGRTR